MINIPLLIALTEGEKKALLIIFIILTFIFLLFGILIKAIKSWANIKGKAIDGYMYDLVKFGIIKTPSTFRSYVLKRETRTLYLTSRWTFRIFIIASGIFMFYVHSYMNGDFNEAITLIKNLFPELSWPTTTMFGIEIICDWPTIIKEASAELSLKGYITYIYALILIYFIFKMIHDILIFNARISRSGKVSNSAFGKNLDNGVDRIDE